MIGEKEHNRKETHDCIKFDLPWQPSRAVTLSSVQNILIKKLS